MIKKAGACSQIALVTALLLLFFGLPAQAQLEIPELLKGEVLVEKTGFSLVFDAKKRIPKWVAYHIEEEEVQGELLKRKNSFRKDFEVEGSPSSRDYTNSGYDRGHMVPAAVLAWSKQSMRDSFLMTNMAPQLPAFNRGIWSQIESLIREWALEYKSLYVISGPILTDSCREYIKATICVPQRFFKVVLRDTGQRRGMTAIGFILSQEAEGELIDFVETVDNIEEVTDIDFFPELHHWTEKRVEKRYHLEHWHFPSLTEQK